MVALPEIALSWDSSLCPQPPDWQIDWRRVGAACPWMADLDGVPQDPLHHAEGDVLIHTRMVAEALAALPGWRALPGPERAALFAAALLHDIGKPGTTREEAGAIIAPGHARSGATLARRLLWEGRAFDGPPFVAREAIVALVRHHGLPIWFLDRADLDRALFAASQVVRLDLLALLAEADARGRACADQAELLARIDLFGELCRERQCWRRPRAFPSDHSRVRYFRSQQRDPEYHAHDDTWGQVTLMSGMPGAGKDTWVAEHLPVLPVISLDAIRRAERIDPDEPQGGVAQLAKEQARALLRRRAPFVWNATNLSRSMRDPLIELCLSYGAAVRIVYLDAPLGEILRRNRSRAEPVPEGILRRLIERVHVPDPSEAHDVEYVS
jgi:putative nucleotidyltransferase with HDIG domain